MDIREHLELESAYEPSARLLVRSINDRLTSFPSAGDLWVRLRPPTLEELESDRARPSFVKFHRVGALVSVAETLVDFVEIVGAGETLLIGLQEFLETWVKIQDWPSRRSNPP